jgi:hypothetical protein
MHGHARCADAGGFAFASRQFSQKGSLPKSAPHCIAQAADKHIRLLRDAKQHKSPEPPKE